MNKQAMVQRVAYRKIAEMEKQAFLSKAKKLLVKMMSSLPRGWQRLLQGADEEEIQRAIVRLKRDKKFQEIVDSAPPKSSLRSLYDYFSFSIKRAFRFAGATLLISAILGVIVYLLGGIALAVGGNVGLFILGSLMGDAFDVEMPDYNRSDKQNKENATEIARGRLLSR